MTNQDEPAPFATPPGLDTGSEVLRSLRRIFHAVDRHSRKMARVHGLTGPQAVCLTAIARGGDTNLAHLARAVSLSPPTVSGILDRLERAGLVRRQRAERDKRQIVIQLTVAGRDLLARSPPTLQDQFVCRLAELPTSRQRQIERSLRDVVRLLEAEDIDAAPLLALGEATAVASPIDTD
jgi:DNA-binding MarR family transcriptional regulator